MSIQDNKVLEDDVKRTLISLLASRTAPITQQQLCCDYVEVTGRIIPYAQLGYSTVDALIKDWNDVFKPVWDGNQCLITYRENFVNPYTKNILGLIREQKGGDNSKGLTGANKQQLTRLKPSFIERSIQDRLLNIISKHIEISRLQNISLPLYERFINDSMDLELITLPELKHLIVKSFPNMNVDFSAKCLYFLKPISIDYLTPEDCDYYHSMEKSYQQHSPGVVNFFIIRLDDDLMHKLNSLFDEHDQLELYSVNELYRVKYEHEIPLKTFGFRSTVDMCDYYSFICYLDHGTTLKRFKIVSNANCRFYQFDFRQNFNSKLTCINDVNSFALQIYPNRLSFIEHVLKKYWFLRYDASLVSSVDKFEPNSLLIVNINGQLFRAVCFDGEKMIMFFMDYGWFKCVRSDSVMAPNKEIIESVFSIPAQTIMSSFAMTNYPKQVLSNYLGFLSRNRIMHTTILSQDKIPYNVALKVETNEGLIEIYDRLTIFQECYRDESNNNLQS